MKRIEVLPSSVVVRIAAGEVIERPACIVKELIENAIDAGATRVEISISEGGKSFIEIKDNGHGIPEDQLELALTPHATSKLRGENDLWSLSTRGFRGEALASIASVSQLEIQSKSAQASMGAKIVSEGGTILRQEPCAVNEGTVIRCKNLFFNTPVRMKFLKAPSTEKSHIDKVIRRVALSEPSLEFSFYSDNEQIYHLPSAPNVQTRIQQLFGKDVSAQLREFLVHENTVSVHGFVSTGEYRDGTASDIWIFVNQRPVQDKTIMAAIMEGYRTALMQGRYPLTFIHVTCPPEMVDVNIHPRKNEVRFTQGQIIFRIVSQAVTESLTAQSSQTFTQRFAPSPQTVQAFQNLSLGSYASPSAFSGETRVASEAVGQYSLAPSYQEPSVQLLGQLDQTYILVKADRNLMIIDQHAAHERVLFERFRANFIEGRSQKLLIPEVIELSFAEEQAFITSRPTLEKVGFEFEDFGMRTFRILATPLFLKARSIKPLLLKILQDPGESLQKVSFESWVDDICARLACHAAVRAHDPLSFEETRALLQDLQATRMSSYCPHGRPSWLELSTEDLEKMFKRVV